MLEAVKVTCGYEKRPVLIDLDFRLKRGEMVGIIGPNGSGKTTLLRLLSRVLVPERGALFWKGRDLWSFSSRQWAKQAAVVSQSPPLCDLTVEEFVLLGRIPYLGRMQFRETKKDREAVKQALEWMGLSSMKDRYLGRMSGGERQLALIARALAQEPELLFLDEPITHLDISHQVLIMDLIRRLNREIELTVVVVLHDLNLAGEYCQRLLLMSEGRIVADGTPERVLQDHLLGPVYRAPIRVDRNPYSRKPLVLTISQDQITPFAEGVSLGRVGSTKDCP